MDKVIQVASREALLSTDYIEALAKGLISLVLPRRKVLDWLAELIFGWLESGGKVADEFGNELIFADETIDDVHGQDATVRVISSIIAYGRGKPRQRAGRISTLGFMRVYDAAFKIAGRPLLTAAREAEVHYMREIVRGFSPVVRARYVHQIRALRREYQGKRKAYFSAAVRRLRLRLSTEQARWKSSV